MLQQIYKRSWLSIPILQLLSTKEGFLREESSKSCAWFTYADNKATSNKYSWICRVMTWLILHQCDTRDHLRVGFPAQFLPASNLQCKDLVALDLEDYFAKCAESSSARIIIYIYIYRFWRNLKVVERRRSRLFNFSMLTCFQCFSAAGVPKFLALQLGLCCVQFRRDTATWELRRSALWQWPGMRKRKQRT